MSLVPECNLWLGGQWENYFLLYFLLYWPMRPGHHHWWSCYMKQRFSRTLSVSVWIVFLHLAFPWQLWLNCLLSLRFWHVCAGSFSNCLNLDILNHLYLNTTQNRSVAQEPRLVLWHAFLNTIPQHGNCFMVQESQTVALYGLWYVWLVVLSWGQENSHAVLAPFLAILEFNLKGRKDFSFNIQPNKESWRTWKCVLCRVLNLTHKPLPSLWQHGWEGAILRGLLCLLFVWRILFCKGAIDGLLEIAYRSLAPLQVDGHYKCDLHTS